MHGLDGHTTGRLYTREALARLGLPIAASFEDAGAQLAARNFAFLPLETFSPRLADLFALRAILGLRSPVHTLARMVNPFDAPASLQSVFHPGYMAIHRDAALLHRPEAHDGAARRRRRSRAAAQQAVRDADRGGRRGRRSALAAAAIADPRAATEEPLDLDRLAALWRGETEDETALAAIVGTIALALTTLGAEHDPATATARAEALWRARDRARLAAAA